jgi:hypothetical protein
MSALREDEARQIDSQGADRRAKNDAVKRHGSLTDNWYLINVVTVTQ